MVLRNLITIRQHIDEGCISWSEIAYLQEHQATIAKFLVMTPQCWSGQEFQSLKNKENENERKML